MLNYFMRFSLILDDSRIRWDANGLAEARRLDLAALDGAQDGPRANLQSSRCFVRREKALIQVHESMDILSPMGGYIAVPKSHTGLGFADARGAIAHPARRDTRYSRPGRAACR